MERTIQVETGEIRGKVWNAREMMSGVDGDRDARRLNIDGKLTTFPVMKCELECCD